MTLSPTGVVQIHTFKGGKELLSALYR